MPTIGLAYAPALAVSSCTFASGPCQWQLVYHPPLAASHAVRLKRSAVQGRDANRLLQRVIKAEEKKKKLPKMIARLRQQLAEWQAPPQNNKAFVLGHVAYDAEVLDLIEEELKVMADVKPRKVRYLLHMHWWPPLQRGAMCTTKQSRSDAVMLCRSAAEAQPNVQPAPKGRPGTAGGKPPRDAASTIVAPPQAALRMIARAHDLTAPPPQRPQTAPSMHSVASASSRIQSRPEPALSGDIGSAMSDAPSASELSIQQTPIPCAVTSDHKLSGEAPQCYWSARTFLA